jgi:hypothetical protein
MASPVQVGEDGGRKFDVKDASWASEMTSDRRRLLLKEKSLPVCPFPTIGLSDAGNNALQAHRLSISVHPVPLPMLAEGGRLAGRSSVSPQVAGARKRAATVLAMREKARAYGTTNACVAGNTELSRSAPTAGLLVKHTCFRAFSIGNLDLNPGVHVPNRANLERETSSSKANSNLFLGRWNVGGRGSRSNPKKLDWTCELECPVEMLLLNNMFLGLVT